MSDTRLPGPDSTVHENKPENSVLPTTKPESYADRIIGTWVPAGMENASFVIEKNKIFYPEEFESYEYLLSGDSLKIKYDENEFSFQVKLNGADTLILTMDEEEVFHRSKK
jgi:hypothetical protein